MAKRLRRILMAVCAAVGVIATQTVPAHAADDLSGSWENLRVVASGRPCFAPGSNSWGAVVHAIPCDGNSNKWALTRLSGFDDRGGAWYVAKWLPNNGCLVPNWERTGAPVVVSGPCDRVTGGDYTWYAWPEGGVWEFVSGGNTNLVLDMDAGTGHVQVWTANYGDNQKWFIS